ncbi:MAG: sulfotransferase [Nitrosomonadales bacterium]|nr:sulfotransferase [Nitrosomonadales bacterium]
MTQANNRLIVVLGMHRSGTSALTRGLQVLGVNLGDRMMSANESINAKGFWEDLDLNALNIEMLSAIHNDWHHIAHIEERDVKALTVAGYFARAAELLHSKIGNSPLFAFKDPRVAKLLPFWKEVFVQSQLNVSYILAVRHPLSVAKSLAKRDGFDIEKGYLLWLGHVLTSLVDSAGERRVLVDYDRLMQSPDRELGRIAKKLDLELDPAELQSYKSEFLDEGLRHTVYGLSELQADEACPPIVREIYTALLDVASDQMQLDDAAFLDKMTHWVDEFERIKAILNLVDRYYVANQVMNELDGKIASLNKIVVGRNEEAVRTKAENRVKFIRAMAEFDRRVAEYEGQIAHLVAEQARIYSSTSWKITKPLRYVVSHIRNLKRRAHEDDEQ